MITAFDRRDAGMTIQFQSRGLCVNDAETIWRVLTIKDLLGLAKQSENCTVILNDRLCVNVLYKGGNTITVRCGKVIGEPNGR